MNVITHKAGTTDVSVVIRIVDSTDGTPETDVVFNTSGIDLRYRREGAADTAITEADLATPALTDAHTDGGFLHIGNGYYRLDLPDAACASGVTGVLVHGTVTGMVVIGTYIQLVAYDPLDTVRLGLTALPNAAADAAGGLPISDAGGLDLDTKLAATNEVTAARMGALTDWINGGRLDLLLDAIKLVTDALPDAGALSSLATAAGLADVPTVAEFEARTIPAADYFDPVNDPVASVTLVDTCTTNTDMRGTDDAALATDLSTVGTNVSTLLTRIPAALFSGITSLAQWLGLLAGKQTGDSTARTELRATGAGSGSFDETTDSLEAIRDRGDAAYLTATGFSTHAAADVWAAGTRTLTAGTNIALAKGTGVTGFNDLSAAQVNAEVVDALNTDTYAEPGQGAPAATASLATKLGYLYKAWRNRHTQTATEYALYADDATTKDQEAAVSDDATTFERGEIGTGA